MNTNNVRGKVLLSFVGDTDPYGKDKNDGNIIAICHLIRPDKIYFFQQSQKSQILIKKSVIWKLQICLKKG